MAPSQALPGPRHPAFVQRSGLLGQTVVVIDGISGVGLHMTRRAKAEGARLVVTAHDAGRLEAVADDIGVEATAAFDARDVVRLEAFLMGLPTRVDHVALCVHPPVPVRLDEADFAQVRRPLDWLLLPLCVAWFAVHEMTEGGSLVFVAAAGTRLSPIDVVPAMSS